MGNEGRNIDRRLIQALENRRIFKENWARSMRNFVSMKHGLLTAVHGLDKMLNTRGAAEQETRMQVLWQNHLTTASSMLQGMAGYIKEYLNVAPKNEPKRQEFIILASKISKTQADLTSYGDLTHRHKVVENLNELEKQLSKYD